MQMQQCRDNLGKHTDNITQSHICSSAQDPSLPITVSQSLRRLALHPPYWALADIAKHDQKLGPTYLNSPGVGKYARHGCHMRALASVTMGRYNSGKT